MDTVDKEFISIKQGKYKLLLHASFSCYPMLPHHSFRHLSAALLTKGLAAMAGWRTSRDRVHIPPGESRRFPAGLSNIENQQKYMLSQQKYGLRMAKLMILFRHEISLYLLVEKRISNSEHLAVRTFSGEAHLQWLEQIHRLSFAISNQYTARIELFSIGKLRIRGFSSEGIVCKFWPSCINTGSKINVYLTNINWLDFVWEALENRCSFSTGDWTGPFVSTPLITRIP